MSNMAEQKENEKKERVAAMRNATKNMEAAIARIDELEEALLQATTRLTQCTKYIPENAYAYDSKNQLIRIVQQWAEDTRRLL